MQRPTVRQLEYAVAVADELHFGRAARSCAVTQPALSAQIQQLEELLGVQLFERGRRGVLVTAAGQRVIERAREALEGVDEILASAASAAEPLTGSLRMGVIPTVAPYVLPPLLPAIRRAYPRLQLVLREDQTARLVAQLEAGALDVLLLALPVEEAELAESDLFEESFWFVGPAAHPLAAARPARVPESALSGEEVLLLEDGHCLRAQALAVCQRAGAHTAGRIQATSLNTLVQMVANGLGVTLLPERSLDVEVHRGDRLVAKRFRAPEPSRRIGLAWRRGAARADEFELLAEAFRTALERRAPSRRGAR